MIHPLAQEPPPPPSSSSCSHSSPKFDAGSCAMTPADFATDTETQVFYAPHSPDLPHPQQPHHHQQRAYSVTAMPSELQRTAIRHQQHLAEQQRRQQQLVAPDLPWWQHYYQLYHYHPPPGRRPTIFGPYLLLQTLGEGEFGKVKLGIHIETGHEVAIKLIKKDNIDSSSRMSKVEREISVLRQVRHPYIVKLYDVIETERYIGIILQCASGGELFEYILAHRYLREKDASRLFAQLISGVHYMHQKHIVHRDLKLENLLLDKNLCVIITDFGFANQFSSAKDDLMSTSCGSPCYAAPELVISEGLYVGSAVDIWSCGVILYAMLCGYLPFDDDPANPDGDNINLLYKYILNTPLAFPDYVSAEARDLLSKMLVPDPAKRCTMEDIMSHPWLSAHRALFEKSLEDLEHDAMSLADLPLSVTEPPLSPTPNHTRRNTVPAGFDISNNSGQYVNDAVVPTAITEQSEQGIATDEQPIADQTVPKEMEEKEKQQQQQLQEEEEAVYEPERQQDEMQYQKEHEEQQQQQQREDVQPEAKTAQEEVAVDEEDKMQVDTPEEKPVEEDKQEQKEASSSETEPHDVSSIDLGASTHTDSDSTKENAGDEAARPQSPRKRNTDRILSFLTPSASSNRRSNRPFSMSGDHQTHSTLANSILHAKFLSSTQRADGKLNSAPPPSTAAAARASGVGPGTGSVSTPYQHQKPLPPSPSVTQQHSPQPTVGASHPVRGTRRKALSLLVNPLSDTEKARRSTSVRPTIKTPRMTPPKEEDEPKPSVSEHSTAQLPPSPTSPTIKHRSAGKKLMDWFKKKPISTKHNENLYPGRPLAAYGMDFNDAKLRVHHGAVDQHALTSRSPQQVFSEVRQTLLSMGIDVKDDGEYKLKGIRRKRKTVQDHIKKRRTTNPRLVMLLRGGNNQSSERVSAQSAAAAVEEDTLYGDPSKDPGEEVRFSVELCKIKNLPGLYIVDIRRMRGNVWSYKFIYHAVLNALDLSGKGGYMSTRSPSKDRQLLQPPVSQLNTDSSNNRTSVASSSNASVVDEKAS